MCEPFKIFAFSQLKCLVIIFAGTIVFIKSMVADSFIHARKFFTDLSGLVSGAIVRYDQLEVRIGLIDHRFDSFTKVVLTVIYGKPDGY